MSDSEKPNTSPAPALDQLVWVDLEMTGLDSEHDQILETALLLTDKDLNITARGPHTIIHHPQETLTAMDSWNRKHHRKSGLWDAVLASTTTLSTAEALTVAFLKQHCQSDKLILAGNSIWQDRRFIIKHMPALDKLLHYRMIDVSSIKQLIALWYPHQKHETQKKHTHRAMDDIEESIAELRFYREHVFVPTSA